MNSPRNTPSNLVEILRDSDSVGRALPLAQAADRIEQLEGAVLELREVLSDWLRIAEATGGDSVIGNRARAAIRRAT